MSITANGSVAQNRNGIGASSRRHPQRYGNRGRGCRRRLDLRVKRETAAGVPDSRESPGPQPAEQRDKLDLAIGPGLREHAAQVNTRGADPHAEALRDVRDCRALREQARHSRFAVSKRKRVRDHPGLKANARRRVAVDQHRQRGGREEDDDAEFYLFHNPDVAAANVNPLDHYNIFGWHEGRDPSVGFDSTSHASAYPDVAAAERQPGRALAFGIFEGRSPFADGM